MDVTRVPIYRPYPDEVPWDLFADAGVAEQVLAEALDPDFTRLAKVGGRSVGGYIIRPRTPTCYELVALTVAAGYRGKGLGRWLLGHAIGLAESRGGREIVTAGTQGEHLLAAVGFEREGAGLRLTLTPE